MIAIDTNVVIRLLTADDREQLEVTKKLFRQKDIFISTTVILECEWVLRYAYRFNTEEVSRAFKALLGLPNVICESPTVISQAIEWHEVGMDFADATHLAKSQSCQSFRTFDKKFIKLASKFTSFEVREP